MSDLFALWKGSGTRAADAWRRIQDKPTSVVLKRGNTKLSAQTVRVEYGTGSSEQTGAAATVGGMTATIFGVKDHPTITDTDIQRGDRVVLDDAELEVVGVIVTNGEIQAYCEVRQS